MHLEYFDCKSMHPFGVCVFVCMWGGGGVVSMVGYDSPLYWPILVSYIVSVPEFISISIL